MKKTVIGLGIIMTCLMVRPTLTHAQGMMWYSQESSSTSATSAIQDNITNIMTAQGVQSRDAIDCTKISRDALDKLGDAVMDYYHPGPAHEAMDAMMGGEGSSTLEEMHIGMGEAYLGCRGGIISDKSLNSNSDSVITPSTSNPRNMSPGWSFVPWIIGSEVVILLVVVIRYMWIKGSHEQRKR